MGNCQAADAAAVVIQHPDGASEQLAYGSLPATQVMAAHPGHYVALVVTSTSARLPRTPVSDHHRRHQRTQPARYLKLLRPDDPLLIGHIYSLFSYREVLRASKRHVRLSRLLKQDEKEKALSSVNVSDGAPSADFRQDIDCCSHVAELENSAPAASQEELEEDDLEAELDTELEQAVQGMMKIDGARHGQWRPALQSIAEVGTLN